ncbi:MAG: aspartate--tRNA(Asn) ligase [Deltaproteobacteria bacterium]|nr:aspartate--tRNA(Asn) ligase [Deltaproteobacteria bacterium]
MTPLCLLPKCVGQVVTIAGWLDSIRGLKNHIFLILRRGNKYAQCVVDHANEHYFNLANKLRRGSTLKVRGLVVENSASKHENVELIVEALEVFSVSEPLPFTKWNPRVNLDTRLKYRWLDLRRESQQLVFEIQTFIEYKMREFWVNQGFIEIHSPKLLGHPSESGAELFELDYFGQKAYLAQSPQFYKQMAMCAGFDRVFEIGPVFRANPSFTSRHDTEFTSIDCEIAWIESHEDIMAFEEQMLAVILASVKNKYGDLIRETFGRDFEVPTLPFPRISFEEANNLLGKSSDSSEDLSFEDEKVLAEIVRKKYNHEFVFISEYPWAIRPFYHMRDPKRPNITRSFDLIWKGTEITTGAQREHRYNILVDQAIEKLGKIDSVDFFLEFFKYGAPPHGGFGFGLTRFLMILLGFSSVKEVTFVYRGPNRLVP